MKSDKRITAHPRIKNPVESLANTRHEFGEHGGVNMSIEASSTFTVIEPETMPALFQGRAGPDKGCYLYGRHFNPTVYNLGRQMAAERDIEPEKLIDAIAEAISSAARKQYKDRGVRTEIDPETGRYPTSRPLGDVADPEAKLYAFKYKTAQQPITNSTSQLIALDTSVFFATGDFDAATVQGLVNMGLDAEESYSWIETDTFQMINHGVSTGALFLLVGIVYERRHNRMIAEYGGIAKVMPIYATFFLIITMSSIGLPTLNGFIGEFTILIGVYNHSWVWALFAATGIVLGAAYMLWLYQRVFFGELSNEKNKELPDLNRREQWTLIPLIILAFWIGLYPKPFFDRMAPTVDRALERVAVAMPADAETAAEVEGRVKSRITGELLVPAREGRYAQLPGELGEGLIKDEFSVAVSLEVQRSQGKQALPAPEAEVTALPALPRHDAAASLQLMEPAPLVEGNGVRNGIPVR